MRVLILSRMFPLAFALLLALPAQAQYNPGQSIPGALFDISNQTGNGLGVAVPVAEADEGLSPTIDFATAAPGFSFSYFGAAVPGFKVSSNGHLTFLTTTTSASFGNGLLPATAAPNGVVAPFWDDLVNTGGTAGTDAEVDYYYDQANGRFIVQWTNFRRFVSGAPPAGALTFQVQLYATGVVEYHYATIVDPGLSYTVGLENLTGTSGTSVVINGALPTGGVAVQPNSGYRFTLATGPVALSFVRDLNFVNAGECPGFSRSVAVTVYNTGTSSMTISGATVTGSPAFFVPPSVVFPITVAPGATAVVTVGFSPAATQTGVLTGQFTINTTGGDLLTALAGTANTAGAGYAYRSSVATDACGSGVTAPGTAFIPLTGHTRVPAYTAGTADNGRFALNLNAAFGADFPSYRINGVDFTSIQLYTNGLASTSSTTLSAFYGGLPNAGSITFQAAAMDLTFDGVSADAAGVGGAPGLYYGLSDVDENGTQDLVVTWWHAYDKGSVPGATGQYLTTQLVVFRGARANEEARIEFRFPDGNDANGVAYRQNTNVADSPTDTSIENDATTGITEVFGSEASIYRLRNGTQGAGPVLGGPLYATGGRSVGVRFEPEAQAIATGQAGWRMLGMPVRSQTVLRLTGINLVQGVQQQYPQGSPNVFTGYDGAAFVPATSTGNALAPGQGFLWYLYAQDIAVDPTVFGGGTSQSYALPMRLEATGAETALQLGSAPVSLSTAGDGFNLVANPFRDDLDVSGLGAWARGGTLVSAVPQVWDPTVGGSGSYVSVSGSVSSWQGFFIQTTPGTDGATGLSVPTSARSNVGTFLGRSGQLFTNEVSERTARSSAATIHFELAGADAATGAATLDRAATLVFDDAATDAWDLLDANKLAPLAASYATVGFQEVGYDGAPAVKSQESRPADAASFTVPLVVDAVGTAPALTLSWAGVEALPSTWSLQLRDLATGATTDLREAASYGFEQASDAALALAPEALVSRTTTAAQAKAGAAARFELVVTTGRGTASENTAITEFALAAPAPNPTSSVSTIRYDVPEASRVSVAVYDLLGRRVAILADRDVSAGRHEARFDAGALAPGVYVVRMQAGTFLATQRVTVVR